MEKPVFNGEVLLCEDNKMNQDIIRDHLAKVGLKTVVTENGVEGVEAFKRRAQNGGKPFDLIFMDIQMPVMDGLEAGAEILKIDTHTPIIAMTANGMPADREQYTAHGMKDCLTKPFTSYELWECLLKYLTPVSTGADGSTSGDSPLAESDEKFRKRLIHNFINENQNRYDEIVSAINAGNIKMANRLAHSLKSNAGYLGKTGLQKAAQDIENLLKNEKDLTTPDELNTLKVELDAALKEFAVDKAEKPGSAAVPRGNIDTRGKQVLINKLELLLDSGNPECLNLIDALRAMPKSEEMIAQMEDFNFDTALEILEKLKREWR
ncbi:MAG: response regulator [Treponema sp.]|nr:response regulator [Treponema sp.]